MYENGDPPVDFYLTNLSKILQIGTRGRGDGDITDWDIADQPLTLELQPLTLELQPLTLGVRKLDITDSSVSGLLFRDIFPARRQSSHGVGDFPTPREIIPPRRIISDGAGDFPSAPEIVPAHGKISQCAGDFPAAPENFPARRIISHGAG
jgi:hypothetical protein